MILLDSCLLRKLILVNIAKISKNTLLVRFELWSRLFNENASFVFFFEKCATATQRNDFQENIINVTWMIYRDKILEIWIDWIIFRIT